MAAGWRQQCAALHLPGQGSPMPSAATPQRLRQWLLRLNAKNVTDLGTTQLL